MAELTKDITRWAEDIEKKLRASGCVKIVVQNVPEEMQIHFVGLDNNGVEKQRYRAKYIEIPGALEENERFIKGFKGARVWVRRPR